MQTVKNKPTPRQLEEAIHSGPRKEQAIRELYAQRELYVAALVKGGMVGPDGLGQLDRLGRFQVADLHWGLCTPEAKKSLLQDTHSHVRSAAELSWQRDPTR